MSYSRIVIIGSPGAGKTTLAQQLGSILNILVFHLDRYFWIKGWIELSRAERVSVQVRIMAENKRWIIEGTYLGTSDDRLKAADTIIFLDTPFYVCLLRIFLRHLRTAGQSRIDLPPGCTDLVSKRTIAKIFHFPFFRRGMLLTQLAKIKKERPETDICILRSETDIQDFLFELSHQYQQVPMVEPSCSEYPTILPAFSEV